MNNNVMVKHDVISTLSEQNLNIGCIFGYLYTSDLSNYLTKASF